MKKKKILLWCAVLLFPLMAAAQETVHYDISCPGEINPGDTFSIAVTFNVQAGWHLYAPVEINILQQMQLTEVRFGPLPAGLRAIGSLRIPASQQKGSCSVYEGENHVFRQSFVLEKSTQLPEVSVPWRIMYQACNELMCMPPVVEKSRKVIRVRQQPGK